MSILKNDYTYNKILEYILFYLYKYLIKIISENNTILSKPVTFKHINCEVINYSLVSKRWFESISTTLTNHVINYNNYNLLRQFTINPKTTTTNSTVPTATNEEYKLIKLKNSFIIYDSIKSYHIDQDNGIANNFRKIVVNVFGHQSGIIDFLKSTDRKYPDNVKFVLFQSKIRNSGENQIYSQDFNQLIKSKKRIHTIRLEPSNFVQGIEKINLLTPERVTVTPDASKVDYAPLFKNPNLKSIKVYDINFTPRYFNKFNCIGSGIGCDHINQPSKLKVLLLRMQLDLISNILSGSRSFLDYVTHSDTMKEDWNEMIKIIANKLTSLKHFSISNSSPIVPSNLSSYYSTVTQGLKTILSSPKSNIETLELVNFTNIDALIMDGLIQSRSIRTIIFNSCDPTPVIQSVLSKNRNIKHLIFIFNFIFQSSYLQLFHLLLQHSENIDLYSITYFTQNLTQHKFNEVVDLIKLNQNKLNIKEYNIYLSEIKYNPATPTQILLSNGSVINIRHLTF